MAMQDSTNPLQGVSGPGQYSKRTDLEYQSPEYGAGVEYAQNKSGAPLASTPEVKGEAPSTFRRNVERSLGKTTAGTNGQVTPLFAESAHPGTPVTEGIDLGAGAGSNALMMRKNTEKLSDALVKMLPYDTTGEIGILYQDALSRGN